MNLVVSILIGLAAGCMSGMFGIGGGIVIVPMLVYFLHFDQHKAQGTSLAILLPPIGILGVMNYWKAGHIDIKAGALIALGFVLGGYLGSKLTLSLDPNMVRKTFALFLVAIALQMWFKKS